MMRYSLKRVVRALALLTGSLSLAASADDPGVNRLLASQCSQCHGTNGYAVGDIDSLAGESAKDLREDLADMRSEDRPEEMMDHQALGYTSDQIRRIANYFAGFPEDSPGRIPGVRLRPTASTGGGGDVPESGSEEAEREKDDDRASDEARAEKEAERAKQERERESERKKHKRELEKERKDKKEKKKRDRKEEGELTLGAER